MTADQIKTAANNIIMTADRIKTAANRIKTLTNRLTNRSPLKNPKHGDISGIFLFKRHDSCNNPRDYYRLKAGLRGRGNGGSYDG